MFVLFGILAITIIILAFALRLYQKSNNGICKSIKSLQGKTVIVTGGTTGIGLEVAKDFARRGARLIVACPFQEEGMDAEKLIKEETNNEKVTFQLLDLGSLDSVRKFVKDFLKTETRLDILINNAAVGIQKNEMTPDGLRFIMQVNYFGHFLLTLLLLPLMRKTGKPLEPSRIVNTSSISHIIGIVGIHDLNRPEFIKFQSYGKSKIALIIFAYELAKRLKGDVVVNSLDTGLTGTRIFESAGWIGVPLRYLLNIFFKTPQEGAQTTLHVALDPKAGEVSGEFFLNCKQSRAVPWAYNDKVSAQLWEDSVKFVKLSEDELKKCLG